MSVVTSFTTYTGKQSEFKDLVMAHLWGFLNLKDLGFNIMEDIQSTKTMYKDQYLDKITKKRNGCTPATTETGTGIQISSFPLTVNDMFVQLVQCAAVFDATIAETARKKGVDINNLEGTVIESYILERIAEDAARDIYRIFWLGDTTLTDTNYTMFDGIFKKTKAGFLAVDGTTSAGTIAATDLLPANIQATLQRIYDAQSYELRYMDDASKIMFVTDPVWIAYERYLQSTQFSGVSEQRVALINGIQTLMYNGIPMANLKVISKYLALDFASGSPAAISNPNRVLLTLGSNHYIATDTMTDTASVELFYDRRDDQNYTRMRYKLGYNYAYGFYNTIAGY